MQNGRLRLTWRVCRRVTAVTPVVLCRRLRTVCTENVNKSSDVQNFHVTFDRITRDALYASHCISPVDGNLLITSSSTRSQKWVSLKFGLLSDHKFARHVTAFIEKRNKCWWNGRRQPHATTAVTTKLVFQQQSDTLSCKHIFAILAASIVAHVKKACFCNLSLLLIVEWT